MRDRIREFVVIAVKTGVSALVAWFAARQIDVPEEVRTSLEALLTGLGVGVVNYVLNVVADMLRKVPGLGAAVDIIWPAPAYNTNEIAPATPEIVAPEAG